MKEGTKKLLSRALVVIVSMLICFILCFSLTACGTQGEQGPKGDTGSQGAAGKDGVAGKDGADGKNGADGQDRTATAPGAGTPLNEKSTMFYSDYDSMQEVYEAGVALNREIAAEGYILLKNEKDSLPIAAGSSISLFGKSSAALYTPLETAGFDMNGDLKAFYANNTASGPAASRTNHASFNATGETPQSMYTQAIKDTFASYSDTAVVVFARAGGEGSDLARASFAVTAGQTSAVQAYPTRDEIESGTWTPVGGKGRESDPFEHELCLDDNEEELLDMLQTSSEFDNVVVLLNSTYAMEVDFLEMDKYSKVKSCIWMPGTGVNGLYAVGDILKGAVNPSGRTPDTLNADFTQDPTWNNYANNFVGNEKEGFNAAKGNQYTTEDGLVYRGNFDKTFYDVAYEEGIYMGYKYYETRGFTEYQNTGNYKWYNDNMVYPFGYGLSYTDFTWELVDSTPSNRTSLEKYGKIAIDVKVTNTGDVAGKEVVQLYFEAPYYNGSIEKSKVELIDFAKTGMLQPGASQTVKLRLDVRDLASYDYNDANENGFIGFEAEEGKYKLYISEHANSWAQRETKVVEYNVAEDFCYDTDENSGGDIENRFDTVNEEMNGRSLSRVDWEGTWPTRPLWFDVTNDTTIDPLWAAWYRTQNGGSNWTAADTSVTPVYLPKANAELVKEDGWLDKLLLPIDNTETMADNDYTISTWYDEANPNYPDANGNPGKAPWYRAEAPNFRAEANRYTAENPAPIKLADMKGLDFNDEMWDKYLDQFSARQAVQQIITAFDFEKNEAFGIPETAHADGPFGIKQAFDRIPYLQTSDMMESDKIISFCSQVVVAASFSKDLAYRYGEINGDFGLWTNTTGWYSPGANMHRTPFSGRNNNYFSEDAILSGIILAKMCEGCTEKGMVTFIKHFALNDQETNRDTNAVNTWANEQVMRQNYLKPFEMAVKDGGSLGMMTSFNSIGFDWAGASYELLTSVARDEWGFEGIYITDAAGTSQAGDYMSANQMIRAGQDISLDGVAGGYDIETDTGVPQYCTGLTTTDDANTPTHLWALRDCLKRIQYVVVHTAAMNNGHEIYPVNYTKGYETYKLASASGSAANFTADVGDTGVEFNVSDSGLSDVRYIHFSNYLPAGLSLDPVSGKITGSLTNATAGNYYITVGIADSDIVTGEEWTINVIRTFKITIN